MFDVNKKITVDMKTEAKITFGSATSIILIKKYFILAKPLTDTA